MTNELEQSRVLIRNLENNSKQSQEKYLAKILELLQEKVEDLVEEYPINLEELENLRKYYELLSEARKNHDNFEIGNSERKITEFKQLLLGKGMKIKSVQSLCRECEKLAQIRFELGIEAKKPSQQQNTFTEKQSPNYSNNNDYNRGRNSNRNWRYINSNFTLELQQEWERCGFTYEQCADWINIHPAQKQNEVIKNPTYFVWLRDFKQVDSEWVLNYGNEDGLQSEFDNWLNQQQFHAHQEIPPRQ